MRARLPSLRRAARRASAALMPRAMFSSVSIARCASSSRARSSSHQPRRKKRLRLMSTFARPPGVLRLVRPASAGTRNHWCFQNGGARWFQHAIDGGDDAVPAVRLLGQLAAAGRREAVVACLAVVLGGAPEGGNPAAILEPVKRGRQRAVLDLEHVVRPMFDRVRDGVPVRRAEHQRLEDQQVERALEQFALNWLISAFGHRWPEYTARPSTGVDSCEGTPRTAPP